MKTFKQFVQEQKLTGDETTLDPDFLEKQQKRERQIETRIEKPMKEIDKKAQQSLEQDIEEEE